MPRTTLVFRRMILVPAALIVMLAIGALAQSERIIYSFMGGSDGYVPLAASLALDSSGNLYGITTTGGIYGFGTVFELAPNRQGFR